MNQEFAGYKIIGHLGSGGAGEVYLAEDIKTSAKVAIKLLHENSSLSSNKDESYRRFSDEFSAAQKINSKYVVKALSAGKTADETPFIIYEYLEKGNLQEKIDGNTLIPYNEAYGSLILPLLKGLQALHKGGIIHRDIKPENIFLSKDGYYKIGDCGLAAFSDREARTKTGMIVGTPLYMAPERIFSGEITPSPQTDIYSAGLVIIKALSGQLPGINKMSKSSISFIKEVLIEDIAKCKIPGGLRDILFTSVRKEPELRYKSAAQFLEAMPEKLAKTNENQITRESQERSAFSLKRQKTKKIKVTRKNPPSRKRLILIPLLVLSLSMIALFIMERNWTHTTGDNEHGSNRQWLIDNENKSALYNKALNFKLLKTDVKELHSFLMLEEKEWMKLHTLEEKNKHTKILANIGRSLPKDLFAGRVMKAISLSRKNHRSDSIQTHRSILRLLEKQIQKTPDSYCSQSVDLYIYSLQSLIIRLASPGTKNRSEVLREELSAARTFLTPPVSPDSENTVKSLACGRHMLLLSQLLLRREELGDRKPITDYALSIVKLIPPYEPHSIFNESFFTEIAKGFSLENEDFSTVSDEEQQVRIKKLSSITSEKVKGAKKIRRELRKSLDTNLYFEKSRDTANEIEMKMFGGTAIEVANYSEAYGWEMLCLNDLNIYAAEGLASLICYQEELFLLDLSFRLNPNRQRTAKFIPSLAQEFTCPHLESSLCEAIERLLMNAPLVPKTQATLFEVLITILRADYQGRNGKFSERVKPLFKLIKDHIPMVFCGIQEFLWREQKQPAPAAADFQEPFKKLIDLLNPKQDVKIDSSTRKIQFPEGWFMLSLSVLPGHWNFMGNDAPSHKIRFDEATGTIDTLDREWENLRPNDRENAGILLTFALLHKSDAALAMKLDFIKEVKPLIGRLPTDDIAIRTLGQTLSAKQRLTKTLLTMNPLRTEASLPLKQVQKIRK